MPFTREQLNSICLLGFELFEEVETSYYGEALIVRRFVPTDKTMKTLVEYAEIVYDIPSPHYFEVIFTLLDKIDEEGWEMCYIYSIVYSLWYNQFKNYPIPKETYDPITGYLLYQIDDISV